MTFYPTDRLALFIDGANLYAAVKTMNFDIDYKKLLVDWLDYNGFTMVTKPVRRYTEQSTGVTRTKGNMDIEIAVDMLEIAPSVDHIVLFSGDGDFRRLIDAVQRKGVRVTVVSTVKSQPPMVSDDLRRQADTFVDLQDLANLIGRPRQSSTPRFLQPADDELGEDED